MDFRFKSVKSSFFEEENLRKKVKKKRTALLQRAFVLKRTALFEDFLLLRIVSTTKSINLSLFRTENTQNTNTRSYYIRSRLTFKEFSFCFAAAIE